MKKIFLLFMILGLSLMSFVDTQASTYHSYDLDSNVQELGGVSIRDFFENYNLIQNHDFSNGLNNWYLVGLDSANYSILNNEINFIGNNTITYPYIGQTNIFNTNDYYYVYVELKANRNSTHKIESGTADFTRTSIQANNYTKLSYIRQSTTAYTNLIIQVITPTNFTTNDTMTIDINFGIYVINLTSLGIQPTIYELDYFMKLYQILKIQETSYDTGYDTGNLDGYATGFSDGTTYGQNEYHTGNYGSLDETTGIPYNDGYNAGVSEELDTNYLLSFVQGSLAVLNAPILPNITLGVFVFIPLFFGFVAFLFRLGGKRG